MTAIGSEQSPATVTPDALWARYRTNGDTSARAQLLDRYLGLVHHVAREIGARTPAVEVDELVSAGTIGLVRALDGFDLSRGLAFSTYAVRRIRGAILDDLRSRDWTPRSVRAKNRKLLAATAVLQGRLGRKPEPRELASTLGIDLETFWKWHGALEGNIMVSFDGAMPGNRTAVTLEETIDDPEAPLPGQALAHAEEMQGLRQAITTLPEKERVVLTLYYYEELKLRQIAEILHVTESRISQVRTQALKRLRDRLTDRGDNG
jgi:RNA polymerase sigma factor for flagellar operon FliA